MPLPLPLPDLASLDLLVTVGDRGSINEAAALHGLSQPAASMRLRSLERVLGLQLLERGPSGSKLTPAGTAAVGWAGVLLDDLKALLTGTAALRKDQRTHLNLAASLTVAEYLIPGWLQRLAAAMPEVGVALQMGNTLHVAEMVDSGQADLGFIEGARPPGRMRTKEIRDDDLVIVVGPGHPWSRRRKPIAAAELAATPLVLREWGSGTREVLTEALATHGLAVSVLVELASTTAIKAAAIGGVGPAVLSVLAVQAELAAGQLVTVACEELRLDRKIRAVWSDRRPLSEAAARFLALVSAAPRRSGAS
jgi:DNA-binding transcriptional LysR family regulator